MNLPYAITSKFQNTSIYWLMEWVLNWVKQMETNFSD